MVTEKEIVTFEEPDNEEIQAIVDAISDPDEFYAKLAFRVIYQTNNFFLPQIKDLIQGRHVLNIRPEYQRRLRWRSSQKSKLIESLLLNIPIPPVFFYESEAARYEVMDGQQRLNAIKEFLNNEFRLTSLEVLWPLNGYSYSSCPPKVKRGLDRAAISAIVLLLESEGSAVAEKGSKSADIRRFIFERLNRGGTRLNAQELRNAIYPGNFNDIIISVARNRLFTDTWGIPAYTESDPNDYYENPTRQRNRLYSSMGDCQIVLRYFALKDENNISGSMNSILDRCMERHSEISLTEAEALSKEYIERLELAQTLFSDEAFDLPPDSRGVVRSSVALYDAIMVALDRLYNKRAELEAARRKLRSIRTRMTADPAMAPLLTGQANTAAATKERINRVTEAFSSAIA